MKSQLFYLVLLLFHIALMLPNIGYTKEFDFEFLLKNTIAKSLQLQQVELDVEIGRTIVEEKRGAYYPSLYLRLNSEYVRDLTEGIEESVSPVGDSVFGSVTKFQHSLSLQMNYTLIDFENRKHQVDMAKFDVSKKQIEHYKILKDTKLQFLQVYAQTVLLQHQLDEQNQLLPLYTELFQMIERLYTSGKVSKIDVADAAINVARVSGEMTDIEMQLSDLLNQLSLLTEIDLIQKSDVLMVLPDAPVLEEQPDFFRTPEYQMLTKELEKKRLEGILVQRSILPTVNLYSKFNMYGSNKYAFNEAIYEVKERDVSIGVSVSMPLFEGGVYKQQRHRVQLERRRLFIERVKKKKELEIAYKAILDESTYTNKFLEQQGELLVEIKEKNSMLDRMAAEKLIDRQSYIQQKIELVTQETDVLESMTQKRSSLWKLAFIVEGECKQD